MTQLAPASSGLLQGDYSQTTLRASGKSRTHLRALFMPRSLKDVWVYDQGEFTHERGTDVLEFDEQQDKQRLHEPL